jgi:hypothetical protein
MLQEASIVGLMKTILIILLVYFGIKILARLFAPFLMKTLVKKAEKRFGQQFGNQQAQQQKTQPEGEVSIDKIPRSQKSSNTKVGEYVDYEEIE